MSDRPPGSRPEADRLRELVCAALSRVQASARDTPVGRAGLARSSPASRQGRRSPAAAQDPEGDGRRVVTAADLDGRSRGERIDLPAGSVVTPAARDRAADLGLELVVGSGTPAGDGEPPRLGTQERELVDQLTLHLSRELSSRDLEELACWCRTDCLVGDPDRVESIVRAGADRVGICTTTPPVGDAIAPLIDHTLLKPEATDDDVARLCHEALEYGFASVCINPYYVPLAADLLRPDPCVRVCTVTGFPLGASMPEIKAAEASRAIDDGAEEIDMVVNVGALKSRRDDWVRHDIGAVAEACRRGGAVLKVILETALLTDEEKERGCRLARDAGADFVKTSTGFGPGGATVGDVELMRRAVGRGMGVKAAGGIGSREDAARMIAAGATRIGASAGVKIVRGERSDNGY